jgi:hypothetical protein
MTNALLMQNTLLAASRLLARRSPA